MVGFVPGHEVYRGASASGAEHGYKRTGPPDVGDSQRTYELAPAGAIVVVQQEGRLTVRLREVDVGARDLFTGLGSELQQRHDGVTGEIG
jgi:hypothetical protein